MRGWKTERGWVRRSRERWRGLEWSPLRKWVASSRFSHPSSPSPGQISEELMKYEVSQTNKQTETQTHTPLFHYIKLSLIHRLIFSTTQPNSYSLGF